MDTDTVIAKRLSDYATHNPWDRLTDAERDEQARTNGRPIKWTLDPYQAGTLDERGYIYVYAGGPIEGAVNVEPRKRADGKVDGRSKGVRKCGRCGQSGHNARTCRGAVAVAPTSPVSEPKVPVAAPVAPSPSEAPAASVAAPKPISERRPEMRAAVKVPGRKTCGKCGEVGHNARTCGKAVRSSERYQAVPVSAGKTGRLNTCGRCGNKGHNARTCKG